jgi:hypothetical protein
MARRCALSAIADSASVEPLLELVFGLVITFLRFLIVITGWSKTERLTHLHAHRVRANLTTAEACTTLVQEPAFVVWSRGNNGVSETRDARRGFQARPQRHRRWMNEFDPLDDRFAGAW